MGLPAAWQALLPDWLAVCLGLMAGGLPGLFGWMVFLASCLAGIAGWQGLLDIWTCWLAGLSGWPAEPAGWRNGSCLGAGHAGWLAVSVGLLIQLDVWLTWWVGLMPG
jgi:hypothetical protein